jgi:hypothetical protein
MRPSWFRWGKQDPACRYLFRAIAGPFVFRIWPKGHRDRFLTIQRESYLLRINVGRLEFEAWYPSPPF